MDITVDNIILVLSVITGTLTIFLGIYVYVNNKKERINQTFLFLCASIAVWIATVIVRFHSTNPLIILGSARFTFAAATSVAMSLYYLSVYFPLTLKQTPWKIPSFIYFIITLIVFTLQLTNYGVTNINVIDGVQYDQYGFAYYIFGFFFVSSLLLAIFNLIYKKRFLEQIEVFRVNYILWGFFIVGIFAFFTNVVIPRLTNVTNVAEAGPLATSIFIFLTSVSILRHELFNIKAIATEILTFALWVFIFTRVLLAKNLTDAVVDGVLLILVSIFGILLVRSIIKEVKTKEALAVANVQQANLIRFISHEVKGALGKSRGFFSLISDGTFGEVPFKLKEMSADVYKTVTKGVEMVEDILNASNIRRGTFSYDKKPFDLKAMVSSVTESFRQTAEEKGLSFNLAIPEGNYLYAGDEKQLSHVIKNLIDNSVRYTTAGSVAVTLEKKTNSFQFKVSDTGFGLSDEDKKNLFTEGGKGKESQKVNVESTGYGLYIVKGIVEAHGGKVWADSPGRSHGSVFTVELPITVEAEAKNSAETPTNKSF